MLSKADSHFGLFSPKVSIPISALEKATAITIIT